MLVLKREGGMGDMFVCVFVCVFVCGCVCVYVLGKFKLLLVPTPKPVVARVEDPQREGGCCICVCVCVCVCGCGCR